MKLNTKYPEAYSTVIQMDSNEDDSIEDEINSSTKISNNPSLVKSKTIDCSQLSSTIRETYGLNEKTVETTSSSSFDVVRKFVFDKSSGGQDLTKLFRNARDEIKKFNEGFLGGNNQKQSTSDEK